jgi:hypothetical protein
MERRFARFDGALEGLATHLRTELAAGGREPATT